MPHAYIHSLVPVVCKIDVSVVCILEKDENCLESRLVTDWFSTIFIHSESLMVEKTTQSQLFHVHGLHMYGHCHVHHCQSLDLHLKGLHKYLDSPCSTGRLEFKVIAMLNDEWTNEFFNPWNVTCTLHCCKCFRSCVTVASASDRIQFSNVAVTNA